MAVFGDPADWPDQDLVGWSEEFGAAMVMAGYREGVFPMPVYAADLHGEMGWWSPVERGVLPLDGLRVTRSLRKTMKRYRLTVDEAFDDVLAACAERSRPGAWIDGRIRTVYTELHELGVAHSVEAWTEDGRLAGGLYGISWGGLFAGESMFHAPFGRDASKAALVHLVGLLREGGAQLLDVQWATPHLTSLGVVEIPRAEYLARLDRAVRAPGPDWAALVASQSQRVPAAPSDPPPRDRSRQRDIEAAGTVGGWGVPVRPAGERETGGTRGVIREHEVAGEGVDDAGDA